MEPAVIAAIISAFANVGTKVFEKWSIDWFESPRQEERLTYVVVENYEKIRRSVHNKSAIILKELEDGQNRSSVQLISAIYPSFEELRCKDIPSREVADHLLHEFEFRLKHLENLGLINDADEYFITPIGKAFLNEARRRGDYNRFLF